MKQSDKTVCVTGAGGFIGSWLVKKLLKRGYTVRGSVRTNPKGISRNYQYCYLIAIFWGLVSMVFKPADGSKYDHLRALEGAKERLELVRADILDYKSLVTVIRGCRGVFHVATAMSNDPEQAIEPAVKGTKNVMEACTEMGVKRVVLTSSVGAVYMDPHRNPLAIVDDDCWSNLDYCIQTSNWYCYAKTLAERSAWDLAKRMNIELVVINPGLVLGPKLQPAMDVGTAHIMKYLTGSAKTYANLTQVYVDVRDVAEAHILGYETPSASGHRYLCGECNIHRGDLVGMLAKLCPRCPIPTECSDQINPRKQPFQFSNQKLKDLNLSFTPINKCLADTVAVLHKEGFLQQHLSGLVEIDGSDLQFSRI